MSNAPTRTPSDLLRAIRALPEDEPIDDSRVWYRTQKEHWLGWLREYDSPGAYGRKVTSGRDARFVYNHVVEPKMLYWLIQAAGVETGKLVEVGKYKEAGPSMAARSAWIRRHVPWDVVDAALWRDWREVMGLSQLLTRRRS